MKEKIINFETAKLAKEKDFDIKVYNWYRSNDNKTVYGQNYKRGGLLPPISCGCGLYPAPTQSLLQKWLLDVKHIFVEISFDFCDETGGFGVSIMSNINIQKDIKWHATNITGIWYISYEEALEEGLKMALNLLPLKQQ